MEQKQINFYRLMHCVAYIGGIILLAPAAHAATVPIQVQREEMKSLSIVKVVLKAGYTSDVRVASDQLLAALAKDIKEYGYYVVGASDEGVFNANDPNKAEMQLAGTINHLECDDNTNFRFVSNCDIAVAWELFDTTSSKVVYKVLTRFRREIETEDKYVEEEVKLLLSHRLVLKPRQLVANPPVACLSGDRVQDEHASRSLSETQERLSMRR